MEPVVLTVIENAPEAALGDAVRHLGATRVHTVRPYLGEELPTADRLGDGLIVLGGPMSAYDDDAAPWLPGLRALLLDVSRTGTPTLAVCLGAQLLAVAGGGHVEPAAPPGREAGPVKVYWRPEARTDVVVAPSALAAVESGGRASTFASAHADAISELPEGAIWLASSNMYPFQAFRLGSALGVQFHPEATREQMEGWLGAAVDPEVAARATANGAELVRSFVAHLVPARTPVA